MFVKGVATATAAGVLAVLLALTFGVFSGGTGTPAVQAGPGATLSLDMDITNGGGPCAVIDAVANVGVGGTVLVAVCLDNPGTVAVAAFKYNVNYNDMIALAPEVADLAPSLDDNPDANAGTTTNFTSPDLGGGWTCEGGVGAHPKGDVDGIVNGTGVAFSGGCGSAAGPNTLIDGALGIITFNATAIGSTLLDISAASVTDDALTEIGSCDPTVDTAMICVNGTINVLAPTATNTPLPATDTPTATNTPVPPTATNTPAGPTVNKDPAISNLFLCEDNPLTIVDECDDNGEGELVIQEIVDNVTEPLGAWEIQVKFDHKIFNVQITPNEDLFTDNGRVPDCSLQIVTENWVLFGCVSTGPVGAGYTSTGGIPVGPAVLATLTLTPNEDLKFRLHPGNDNGVTRMILDENCEVVNTLGHPQPGSVNGGLALECGDASVTVRILEGDLNLDCSVDVEDQAIAGRYGTFFGNIFYDPWYDLEPALKDFDIDIKDVQKVYGRDGSTCEVPIPDQDPVPGLSVGPL